VSCRTIDRRRDKKQNNEIIVAKDQIAEQHFEEVFVHD
jgi:hypothetical protein